MKEMLFYFFIFYLKNAAWYVIDAEIARHQINMVLLLYIWCSLRDV